jgi:hypothetical protein
MRWERVRKREDLGTEVSQPDICSEDSEKDLQET